MVRRFPEFLCVLSNNVAIVQNISSNDSNRFNLNCGLTIAGVFHQRFYLFLQAFNALFQLLVFSGYSSDFLRQRPFVVQLSQPASSLVFQLNAAHSATGKQVTGIRNRVAATGTRTRTATTFANTNRIVCADGYDGWFLGMTITGTGINASATVVAALDPDGNTVYVGTAIGTASGRNNTATGTVTLTGTYTGFGSGVINNPACMMAVT